MRQGLHERGRSRKRAWRKKGTLGSGLKPEQQPLPSKRDARRQHWRLRVAALYVAHSHLQIFRVAGAVSPVGLRTHRTTGQGRRPLPEGGKRKGSGSGGEQEKGKVRRAKICRGVGTEPPGTRGILTSSSSPRQPRLLNTTALGAHGYMSQVLPQAPF